MSETMTKKQTTAVNVKRLEIKTSRQLFLVCVVYQNEKPSEQMHRSIYRVRYYLIVVYNYCGTVNYPVETWDIFFLVFLCNCFITARIAFTSILYPQCMYIQLFAQLLSP